MKPLVRLMNSLIMHPHLTLKVLTVPSLLVVLYPTRWWTDSYPRASRLIQALIRLFGVAPTSCSIAFRQMPSSVRGMLVSLVTTTAKYWKSSRTLLLSYTILIPGWWQPHLHECVFPLLCSLSSDHVMPEPFVVWLLVFLCPEYFKSISCFSFFVHFLVPFCFFLALPLPAISAGTITFLVHFSQSMLCYVLCSAQTHHVSFIFVQSPCPIYTTTVKLWSKKYFFPGKKWQDLSLEVHRLC